MPYIDQERVVQELTEACDEMDLRFLRARTVRETIETVKNHINAMPAVDVAPVVHGRWETVLGSNGKEYMVCTECRVQQELTGVFTYCPNCGAKMDGGAV